MFIVVLLFYVHIMKILESYWNMLQSFVLLFKVLLRIIIFSMQSIFLSVTKIVIS